VRYAQEDAIVELNLSRCTVRSLRAEDAASLARYLNDRRISSQLSDRYPHPYTLAHAQGFYRQRLYARVQ
jgi:hypothetical protein